ncbi:MAG TPA: S41 family peptidase, partial [bacterium]|nr:S41 family peptidase [bacterium]
EMKRSRGLVFWWMVLSLLVCLAVGTYTRLSAFAQIDQELREYDVLLDVLNTVSRDYVDPEQARKDKLLQGAIQGMMNTLDPYSVFLPPKDKEDLDIQTKGKFMGVGIRITILNGWLTVESPIPNSPAFRMGILSGDKIIRINGKSTRGLTAEDAVKVLRGPKGTRVKVTILRKDAPSPMDFSITRDEIRIPTLEHSMMPAGIGYIRLYEFREDASSLIDAAVQDLESQGMKAVVLDLRFNTGGLLDEAVKVAGKFLDEGLTIVVTRTRNPQDETVYRNAVTPIQPYPMVLLVNQVSASASEIVAGALQDHGRAVIVGPAGSHTYGKGSVQSIIEMKFGNALKLTTAKYFTPNNRSIADEGIIPDIGVDITEEQQRLVMTKDLIGKIPESATAELSGLAFGGKKDSLEALESGMPSDEEKEKRLQQMLENSESEAPTESEDTDVITAEEVFVEKEQTPADKSNVTYDLELMEALRILRAGMLFSRQEG